MSPDRLEALQDWLLQQEYFTLGRLLLGAGLALVLIVGFVGLGTLCEIVKQRLDTRRGKYKW